MADKKFRTTVNTGINDKKSKQSQLSMFEALDIDMEWQKEWQGMPEFIRGNEKPYQQLLINFATKEDVQKFCELTGQKITTKTVSIWYPKSDKRDVQIYRDVDSEPTL